MNEELTVKIELTPESMNFLDQFEYLAFFAQYVTDAYNIDPDEADGVNRAWKIKTGKPVPDFKGTANE